MFFQACSPSIRQRPLDTKSRLQNVHYMSCRKFEKHAYLLGNPLTLCYIGRKAMWRGKMCFITAINFPAFSGLLATWMAAAAAAPEDIPIWKWYYYEYFDDLHKVKLLESAKTSMLLILERYGSSIKKLIFKQLETRHNYQ